MKRNLKSGITMMSLVIYVILFSLVTVVASMIYTNMNETLFINRGRAINYTEFNKLQYNITTSALNSNDINVAGNVVSYSNGDTYSYDSTEKMIFLNGGILCTNVSGFSINLKEENAAKKLEIDVVFNKYLNELNKKVVSSIEVK